MCLSEALNLYILNSNDRILPLYEYDNPVLPAVAPFTNMV